MRDPAFSRALRPTMLHYLIKVRIYSTYRIRLKPRLGG